MTGGVCLSGRAGSGKSPLARHIVREFQENGYHSRVFSFADAIKQEVWELYGLKKTDLLGRETLIQHGNDRIQTDPTYWVRRLMEGIDFFRETVGGVPVVDDVRREPEYARLSYEGFFRVRVMAPRHLRMVALDRAGLDASFADSEDPTERHHEVWLYDFRRVLNHTSQDFRDAAKQIVGHVLNTGFVVAI